MKFRRRKDKVMATQTEVSLPEPKLDDTGGWEFPDGWSEDDIRDWLTTHPEGRPQQLTLDIDPGLPPTEGDGGESGDLQADRDEYEKTYDQQQAEVVAKLKADGMVAAAYAVPPEQKDVITPENYDPREFLLVHYTVWDDVTSSMVEEERLTAENKELRKRVNALTRGIKKIQKHWSATKAELKKSVKLRAEDNKWWSEHDIAQCQRHEVEKKRQHIFATRLARRLRKARAGRDKRERQLNQANQQIKGQARLLEIQDGYIHQLEGFFPPQQ